MSISYTDKVNSVLHNWLDVLFPPRDTERLLREVSALPLCPNEVTGVHTLLSYEDTVVRAAIVENKFHRNRKATELLASCVAEWLKEQSPLPILIPIPLGRARERTRGYNQVEQILHRLPPALCRIERLVLTRTKETVPQVGLERTERIHNMNGAFTLSGPLQADASYLLIDDVVTTGATLKAARATLAPHLPSTSQLTCLALAH